MKTEHYVLLLMKAKRRWLLGSKLMYNVSDAPLR